MQGEHLVAIYDPSIGVVLAQRKVASHSNEVPTSLALVAEVDLLGVVLTADAMHTQQALCQQVVAQGGDYLLHRSLNYATALIL